MSWVAWNEEALRKDTDIGSYAMRYWESESFSLFIIIINY